MLFLVIGKPVQIARVPTREVIRRIRTALRLATKNQRTKALYVLADGGAVVITEADSVKELNLGLFTNPAAGLLSWEVHPLLTVEEFQSNLPEIEKLVSSVAL